MQMTDEQVWADLERFAAAMKRGATVEMRKGNKFPGLTGAYTIDANAIEDMGGIREIIDPPKKKVMPLNAEEWKQVGGCVRINGDTLIPFTWSSERANWHMTNRMTCHPPGFPNDIRKLWVEE